MLIAFLMIGCDGKALLAGGPGGTSAPSTTPGVQDEGFDSGSAGACTAEGFTAPAAQLRRLSPIAQLNTVRDLLKDPTVAPQYAPPRGTIISELEVEKLGIAAELLVSRGGHLTYLPCQVDGAPNLDCAKKFITDFGRRAYRRPLHPEELTALTAVYTKTQGIAGLSSPVTFRETINVVAQVILQSPAHVYVAEEGVVDASLPRGTRKLSGYERASRLSYALWNTMPDQALLTAAANGDLDTREGVRAQAERLLGSAQASFALNRFASTWLELDGTEKHASLEDAPKDVDVFPLDKPALRAAMRTESQMLYQWAFSQAGDAFAALMTTPRAWVNQSLAAFYGVSGGPADDSAFAWVDLNPAQRSGLFTRAAFLAVQAANDQQSPIRRGVFLYRHALCQQLGEPPANANNTPVPAGSALLTIRAQTDARTQGSCQGCHGRINPLGYTLEHYDGLGAWHDTENGTAVDSHASLVGTDFDGWVTDGVALSSQLATSQMARDCMTSQWFEQSFHRAPTPADLCLMGTTRDNFRQTGNMKNLVLSLLSSDPALFISEAP